MPTSLPLPSARFAPFLEHVNLTVRDPHRSAQLFITLFDWYVRWEGPALNGGRTVHVGDDRFYLALYTQFGMETPPETFRKGRPFNHIGIVVSDIDAVERRVESAGLVPFSHGDYDPGRRFYFFDPDGIEFEIVSYD
ncbi:VOC family protein [Sphingobium lignivorans]|uniref:Enzyme related to lactoylglutathione lyase n=1 Tax=Sphingobium lignivorans TaxID=2735886 RepID=A0ABR6NJC3_9SPHN|nr:VOC family protein [Sphingobium lignivorans]MBB5986289.1 putative enzyme related to lactoylglutathione lyase [Sphingobium lignivorans]